MCEMTLPSADIECSYLWIKDGMVIYEGKMQFLKIVMKTDLAGFYSCAVKCKHGASAAVVSPASDVIPTKVDPRGNYAQI